MPFFQCFPSSLISFYELKVEFGKRCTHGTDGRMGSVWEFLVDGTGLKHASEFKYFGVLWINARDLELASARVLHEALLVSFLLYRSEQWYEGIMSGLGLRLNR